MDESSPHIATHDRPLLQHQHLAPSFRQPPRNCATPDSGTSNYSIYIDHLLNTLVLTSAHESHQISHHCLLSISAPDYRPIEFSVRNLIWFKRVRICLLGNYRVRLDCHSSFLSPWPQRVRAFRICFTVYACLTFISAAIPPRTNQPTSVLIPSSPSISVSMTFMRHYKILVGVMSWSW